MKLAFPPSVRRLALISCAILTPLLLITAVLIANQSQASASSHREAPLISKDAFADNTDSYVFLSPENNNNVVMIGNWIPFEGPEGGPYYWEWDDSALYDIYVDNDGDAKADYTYTLSSKVSVGNLATFLYNVGAIDSPTDADWNRQQIYTVTETTETGATTVLVGGKPAAPSNIGEKSTPNYEALVDATIYDAADGVPGGIKVFAGQTDDPFWVDLQIFDLLTLRGQSTQPLKPGGPPLGYAKGNNKPTDSVSAFNVHSLVLEVPVARLKQGNEPVLGVWAGTRRSTTRVIGALNSQTSSGPYVQVSRLGMPLVNEVVIPLALKDAFNSIPPSVDAVLYTNGGPGGPALQKLLQKSIEDPELGNLLCGLYGVPLPGDANKDCKTEMQFISDVGAGALRSGRGDIVDIFLQGMVLAKPFTIQTKNGPVTLEAGRNINRPANVVPAEMMRINTDIKGDLCSPTPSRLGVLGGDACGFPNGRRLYDDIVEIELAAVAGAAYQVLDGRDASFTFNPALLNVLNDGIDYNDVPYYKNTQVGAGQYPKTFPYLGIAQSGQAHWHTNPFFTLLLSWVGKDAGVGQ